MKYFRNVKKILPAVGLFLLTSSSEADEFYLLNLSLGEESNVSRGIDDFHARESEFVRASISAGKRYQFGQNDSLTFSGRIGFDRFNDLRGFDRVALGAAASYRYKLGFGPFVPALNAGFNYDLENAQGQARDTESARIEFSADKRFRSGFSLEAGIDYQRNYTNDLEEDSAVTAFDLGPVDSLPFELFDFESISAFAAVEYQFINGWSTNFNFRRVNGFTVASKTRPFSKIFGISDAFYSDPAFSIPGARVSWFAYLLETNSDQWEGALSVPLFRDTSVDFSVNWTDISGPNNRNYQNTTYAVTFTHAL